MHPRTARGNRYGLALIGGLLIAGGTYARLRSHGSLGQRQRASDPLLTDAEPPGPVTTPGSGSPSQPPAS